MSGLFVHNVSKSFGSTKVIDSLSLEAEEGELIVLLGPSGCGKSTLLRLISGLEEADSGEIYIRKRRVDTLRPRDRNVALVFQNYSLYPHMTIAENIGFPLKVAGEDKKTIAAKVAEVASKMGLADRLSDRPAQLSGGQRQRVALGRAIIREPDIFLLDEPLSNLDADLRARMRAEIVHLHRALGRTTVHVTHDQEEALTMADRIVLMRQGKIEQMGTPEELYRNPSTLFTARFLGRPQINVVHPDYHGDIASVFGKPLILPSNAKSARVIVGIRPESIAIDPVGDILATVTDCEYMGDAHVVRVAVIADKGASTQLEVSHVDREYREGESVRLKVDWPTAMYFDAGTEKRVG
jgi:multiple sugar transport system ATP-binding protein